jgi:hypothetical protein
MGIIGGSRDIHAPEIGRRTFRPSGPGILYERKRRPGLKPYPFLHGSVGIHVLVPPATKTRDEALKDADRRTANQLPHQICEQLSGLKIRLVTLVTIWS